MGTLAKAQKAENIKVQQALNKFDKEHLGGLLGDVLVDGKIGQASHKRIRQTKFYLGYVDNKAKSGHPGVDFMKRIAHPNKAVGSATASSVKRGQERRKKARRIAKESAAHGSNAVGYGTFEGTTVAAWMVPIFKATREYDGPLGKWQGSVISGVRTPEHSQELCESMCGQPTCPGRCAGLSSNHNMRPEQRKPAGAADVSDYIRFGKIQQAIGSPLINRLPNDRVHYSVTGR